MNQEQSLEVALCFHHMESPQGLLDVGFTPAEQRASDAIIEVMDSMRALYGGNPYNWETEGISAIHVLQKFVQQHWAHRINPEGWGDWHQPTARSHD